jgi:hypothetical protein
VRLVTPGSVVFYVSGHGFGHAARDIQVINALARLDPSVRVTLRTTVPRWFLDASLQAPANVLVGDTDPGIAQPDSLTVDEHETAQRAAVFYDTFERRVEQERDFLRAHRASLVVGDIPPLAFAAAAAAGVSSIAVGNFTWDWIYEAYPRVDVEAPGVRALIARANAQAALALRLPFAGGFASMSAIEDVPLVARHATVSGDDVRRRLNLADSRPLVLATFGGHGGSMPLAQAAATDAFTLVATDYEVGANSPPSNVRVVPAAQLRAAGLTYTDLLSACDVAVTKLGYGIVSECIANGVALLYTLRGRFPEQDVFIRDMPRVLRCREIARDDLLAGRWTDAVAALLSRPAPTQRMDTRGAEVVAARLLDEAMRAR